MTNDADVDWPIENDLFHVVSCSVVDLTQLELRTHVDSALDMFICGFCSQHQISKQASSSRQLCFSEDNIGQSKNIWSSILINKAAILIRFMEAPLYKLNATNRHSHLLFIADPKLVKSSVANPRLLKGL